ncbi:hypothetical protein [Geodermatophilus ruber]|uniref:Uncharacterized protein n=1 Tax=Geodermatophilus ruber TaxID=504800 RepID=A0A1I4LBA7_9ACTN|nr:hypothetical protein [Geodermatophilus ruber]SFL88146.1 hypothetical protein SAMN04488085_1213 [Geodermatophilus ruber]
MVPAERVGDAGPRLARRGLVLDVVDAVAQVGPTISVSVPVSARVQDAGGTDAAVVGDIVCHRLGQLGYVRPGRPAPRP